MQNESLHRRPHCLKRMAAALWLAPFILMTAPAVTRADATDDYVHRQMEKKKIPGLSIAVIRDGHVIKEAAYGKASLELNVPATLDTSYPLASMTKVFTAVAIMQLVQEGRISLDEPVIQILPQLPPHWSAITVRHCLSHTSGLPDVLTDDVNATTVSGDRDAALAEVAKQPLKPAGAASIYNQTGYVLLGMIIEKISGMSYQDFVQSRLINPAGMKTVHFGDGWAIIPGEADLYTALDITPDHTKLLMRDGRPVVMTDKIRRYGSKYLPEYLAPAGYLNGSIRDLVSWETALSHGKLLKSSALAEMAIPYKLSDGKDGIWGLSYASVPMSMFGNSTATKSGGAFGPHATVSYGGGAATWCMAIPDKHLIVIVLTNLQDSNPDALAADIATLYEPSLVLASAP
jgi:CubicO group peptidase (beta-lactamase class C family)